MSAAAQADLTHLCVAFFLLLLFQLFGLAAPPPPPPLPFMYKNNTDLELKSKNANQPLPRQPRLRVHPRAAGATFEDRRENRKEPADRMTLRKRVRKPACRAACQ